MKGLTYDDKILFILLDKIRYFQSHYVYPSQITFLRWIQNQGGLLISRRTFNRYMRHLENRGIVGRIRRVKRDPVKGIQFASTLYSIGYLGLMKLVNLGLISWQEFREYIKNSKPFKARQRHTKRKTPSPASENYTLAVQQLVGNTIKNV